MPRYGIIDDVEIDLGSSEFLSEAERQAAIDVVLDYFVTEMRGNILNRIWYGEPRAMGNSNLENPNPDSDILISIDFTSRRNRRPTARCIGCMHLGFRLVRNDTNGEWEIVQQGRA